jgi:hypothetical protein
MTAPNTETTTLSRSITDFNPDGLLSQAKLTALANANATLTAAQMVNAIVTMTHDANYTVTTDTYANIANQIGYGTLRAVPAGATFDMTLIANGATANTVITLAGGTGVTLVGNTAHGQTVATPIIKSGTWTFMFNANSTITAYRR